MTVDGRRMICERVGNLLVVGHVGEPDEEDWRDYMGRVEEPRIENLLVLAYRGAIVTPAQRAEFVEVAKPKLKKIAVVVESAASRGAATAVSWFIKPLKAFGPGDLAAALEYVEARGARLDEANEAITRISEGLGVRRFRASS